MVGGFNSSTLTNFFYLGEEVIGGGGVYLLSERRS